MPMKKCLVILLCLMSLPILAADNHKSMKIFQGCSGGMMVHMGYLFGQNPLAPADPQGMTWGFGGAARVHLWKHFRVGFDGYVSTMNSNVTDARSILASGSYIRIGSGGVLADACWRFQKVWPYVGAGIGGGAMKGLYIVNGNQADWTPEANSIFNKQPFFYVTPYVGIDWCMKERAHMTFKFDWMLAIHDQQLLMPMGPRFYVGFMFCH